jgi:hypothetical protein
MKINFNEIKKDVKHGYYEILDCKEVSKKFYLTILLENDIVLIHIDNYNDMLQGTCRLEKNDFLSMKKDQLIKYVNEMNFYMYDEIESDESL